MAHLGQVVQGETRALFSVLARERGFKISLISILSKVDLAGEVSLFPRTIFLHINMALGRLRR